MLLLLIPVTIAALIAVLVFTEALDRRSGDVFVRLAVRSGRATPEAIEILVATEVSRRLHAAGLGNRPAHQAAVPVEPTALPEPADPTVPAAVLPSPAGT